MHHARSAHAAVAGARAAMPPSARRPCLREKNALSRNALKRIPIEQDQTGTYYQFRATKNALFPIKRRCAIWGERPCSNTSNTRFGHIKRAQPQTTPQTAPQSHNKSIQPRTTRPARVLTLLLLPPAASTTAPCLRPTKNSPIPPCSAAQAHAKSS